MAPCGGEAILVAARLRPQLPGDGDQKQCLSVAGGKQVLVGGALESGKHAFTFDHAWGGDVSQAEVFAQAAPLVDSVLQGFNSTVFAHGPSGSGKTHTMIGSPEDPGVVTRALDRIFLLASQHSSRLTCVFISVLELYNNEFFDLLDGTAGSRKKQVPGGFTPQKRKDKIEVVRNGEKSTLKGKFTKLTVESSCVASEAIDKALAARATSGTNLNDRSSRSHAIVSIQVQQADASAGNSTVGSLFLVDLAGSERLKLSGVTGDAQTEAVHINTSLSALGNVLTALGKPHKERGIIPYRDSKLTLLLQDALGGNSKTLMIACVNPAADQQQHAVVCLQFAARAKKILNYALVNVDADKTSEIEALKAEVMNLKERLGSRMREVEAARELEGREELDGADLLELAEKTAECDRLQGLMRRHEEERAALEAKLAVVVNGKKMMVGDEEEKGKLRDVQHQLFLHNEKLLEAYRDTQLTKRSLEAKEAELATTKEELVDTKEESQELLRQQEDLVSRNRELEERVRELEMEKIADAARKAAAAIVTAKALLPPPGGWKTPESSPVVVFHTPAPITPNLPQGWAMEQAQILPLALQQKGQQAQGEPQGEQRGVLGGGGATQRPVGALHFTKRLSSSAKKMAGGFRAFGAFNIARFGDLASAMTQESDQAKEKASEKEREKERGSLDSETATSARSSSASWTSNLEGSTNENGSKETRGTGPPHARNSSSTLTEGMPLFEVEEEEGKENVGASSKPKRSLDALYTPGNVPQEHSRDKRQSQPDTSPRKASMDAAAIEKLRDSIGSNMSRAKSFLTSL